MNRVHQMRIFIFNSGWCAANAHIVMQMVPNWQATEYLVGFFYWYNLTMSRAYDNF